MLHDAHFHLHTQAMAQLIKEQAIQGIVNIQNKKEYELVKQCFPHLNQHDIYFSAGIHPWHADANTWQEMEPIMSEAMFIGEIGLDCVWSDQPLEKQREVFICSLAYAHVHHKPVILHIKGMEYEVLTHIQRYSNHYLVHWYSCDQYIKEYQNLDCYFTIGPSVLKDPAVQQVARMIPLNRLLVESDGLEALSWCENKAIPLSEYPSYLQRTIKEIAAIKCLDERFVANQLTHTFADWLCKAMHSDTLNK